MGINQRANNKALFQTKTYLIGIAVLLSSHQVVAAEYSLTWEADWQVSDQRAAYPLLPPNAHFTDLVGTTHQVGAALWKPGELASAGTELVAEQGQASVFIDEINALSSQGIAGETLIFNSVFQFPTSQQITFNVDESRPEVTFISMIAPSPDWFIGVSGLSLQENGVWLDEVVVDLTPWDAGTESGMAFNLDNSPTSPQALIAPLTDSPFQPGATLGTLTFERVSPVPEPSSFALMLGGFVLLGFKRFGGQFRFKT